jgi:hypothetical protein
MVLIKSDYRQVFMQVRGWRQCKNLIKGNKGPIRIILIGDRMVDRVDFQATCNSDPKKESGV